MWECNVCKNQTNDNEPTCWSCGSRKGSGILKAEEIKKEVKTNEFLWEKKTNPKKIIGTISSVLISIIIVFVVKEYFHKPRYAKKIEKINTTVRTNFDKMTDEGKIEFGNLRNQVIQIHLKYLDDQDKSKYLYYLSVSESRNLNYDESEAVTILNETVREKATPQEIKILDTFQNLVYRLAEIK